MPRILVLYDTQGGRTAAMAHAVASGCGTGALIRHVPRLDGSAAVIGPATPAPDPEAALDDLVQADALAIGCPVHFGAPSAAMLAFLLGTARLWPGRALAGRAATVFASAGSGGGAEAALLSLWAILASHGFVLVPGTPEAAQGPGGGPIGAIMAQGTAEEAALARARAQGARLAAVAAALRSAGQGA